MTVTAMRIDDLGEDELASARDRLYPDWWQFSDPQAPIGERPSYRVVCRDEAERELAYRVRPRYVNATIVLER
jgi:hypothetical protein